MATNKKGYMKQWLSKFDGYYVYVIKDLQGNIVYTGKTGNWYSRLSNHTSRNVDTTKDFIKQGNYTIQYLDITNDINSDMELKYLENFLIELYEPPLNDIKNIIRGLDKFRMLELVTMVHSRIDWITYCRCVDGKKTKNKLMKALSGKK